MTRRRGAAILALALLMGCTAADGGSLEPRSTSTPSPASTSSAAFTTAPNATLPAAVLRVIEFDDDVWGVAAAGTTVWVEGDFRLVQLDASSGRVIQELAGWWPTVTGSDLWYMRDEVLVRAEAATGRELATYRPPFAGTAVTDGVLWAASETSGELIAFRLATGKVVHRLALPPGEPKWVQPWQGAIWVVIDGANVLVRVDPESGAVVASLDGGNRPHSVALGFGSLWVIDHGSTTVRRFDPDGTLEATITGPGINVAITATDDSVWAASPAGLLRIDPTTNEVVDEIQLGRGEWYGLAYAQGSLWLTSAEGRRLYQIQPGPR